MEFNAFRDGKVHVMKQQCRTCIFRADSPARKPGSVIAGRAVKEDNAVVCHHTVLEKDQAVCRGFFDRHKTTPLLLAMATGCVEFDKEE
jgi:hypothetical protein